MANRNDNPYEIFARTGEVVEYNPYNALQSTEESLQQFVPPHLSLPAALKARESKRLPPLPETEKALADMCRPLLRTQLSGGGPHTPTSTSPSTLVGSPPSSSRNSTFEEKPTGNSMGSKFKAFFTPEWSLKEGATGEEVRLHKYGALGRLVVDCVTGLVNAVKVLVKVAVPGLYWDARRTEAVSDEETPKKLELTWQMVPGHPPVPFYPLTFPERAACAHGPSLCYDCTRFDSNQRLDYAWRAYRANRELYENPGTLPAGKPSPPENKANWLCRHIVWNQKKQ